MEKSNVIAIVDGREVTQSDLMELLQSIGHENAMQFQTVEGQKKLVDELVMQELLYSDALANGLDQEAEFTVALDHMKKTLLKQYAMKKLLESVDATDAEAKEYFLAHASMFKKPELAHASHILVDSEEKAKEVLAEINAGLDFKEAAQKYSSCPSSAQGGDLGQFSRGQMVPEFDAAVFTMEEGTISEPIQTQFGYHLIQLNNLQKEEQSEFEDVKNQVKQQCVLAKRQAAYLTKKDELSKVYPVQVNA